MFWFKAKEKYIKYKKEYHWYIKDYSFDYSIEYNSSLVHAISIENEFYFIHRDDDPDYGTTEYKNLEEKLKNKYIYVVFIHDLVLGVDKETYDKIRNEQNVIKSISIN